MPVAAQFVMVLVCLLSPPIDLVSDENALPKRYKVYEPGLRAHSEFFSQSYHHQEGISELCTVLRKHRLEVRHKKVNLESKSTSGYLKLTPVAAVKSSGLP